MVTQLEDGVGTIGNVAVDGLLLQDATRQVGDGDAGVRCTQVDREDHTVVAVEREPRGWSTTR